MGISFEQSGRGPLQFGLPEVSELAVQHGFVKKGTPPHAPLASRADLAAFFKAYECNALSSFRKRFCEQPLEPINAATFMAAAATTAHARAAPLTLDHAVACTPEPHARYPELLTKWKSLPWRLARKPGAAHIKTEDYYRLHAASEQAERGDVSGDRPMWCDDGSLDYQRQEEFDAWSKAKGMSREEAIAAFCRIYAEAHTPERAKLNFFQRA